MELRPFAPIRGPVHVAQSTPGDLLFHLRAEREDMTFELERQLLDLLQDAAQVVDETTGFRYFDARDLLGFVDGTANPTGADLPDAALIAADADPEFAGGSYVVVQKYLHDMARWAELSTEEQEAIMGRTKIDNIEIDDDEAPRKSHKSLATIEDDDGGELAILRDNMPFGRPAAGEFGTYFIGYSSRLWVIERMLERMFIGVPPGAYDRLLDFSTAITGTTFFVPTAGMLGALAEPPSDPAAETADGPRTWAGCRGAAVPGHRVAARDGLTARSVRCAGPAAGARDHRSPARNAREVIPGPGPPRCACRGVERTSRCAARRARRAGLAARGARRRRTAVSTTRISISAKAAPRQRRTPPPNGIHAKVDGGAVQEALRAERVRARDRTSGRVCASQIAGVTSVPAGRTIPSARSSLVRRRPANGTTGRRRSDSAITARR